MSKAKVGTPRYWAEKAGEAELRRHYAEAAKGWDEAAAASTGARLRAGYEAAAQRCRQLAAETGR